MFKLVTMFLRARKRKKKPKRKRSLREIPVVRTIHLGDNEYLQTIIGATKKGSKKLDFPYEIPTINTNISIDKETMQSLYYVSGGLALGMIGSAIIKSKSK